MDHSLNVVTLWESKLTKCFFFLFFFLEPVFQCSLAECTVYQLILSRDLFQQGSVQLR